MTLENFKRLSPQLQQSLINDGGRFLEFTYCYSYIVMTHKKPSNVFFVHSGEAAIYSGFPYLLISIVFGWWGIPWGPIYTIQSIINAFKGIDLTESVCSELGINIPHAQRQHVAYDSTITKEANTSINMNKEMPNKKNVRYCTHCGTEITDSLAKFCHKCGSKLC